MAAGAAHHLRIFYYAEHADLFPAKLPCRVIDLNEYIVVSSCAKCPIE